MTANATYDEERKILDLAKPLLKDIYGDFEIDEEQRDRPDAAIILRGGDKRSSDGPAKKIGIEITTVDQPQDMQYLNDEKFAKPLEISQLNALASGGESANCPNKKISIEFPSTYISDGVARKASKYQAYSSTGQFDELIVLAFSSVFDLRDTGKRAYHMECCAYHLSRIGFPYDRVIFVSTCKPGGLPVVVYEKSNQKTRAPERDEAMEAGVEIVKSPILKFGATFNINELFEKPPALSPKKKK